ncbi:MAG: hypothetical protein M3299_05155 [Thermoproteota archaeon]|nr:hypothetical protein [Thermoproteota archaeon]
MSSQMKIVPITTIARLVKEKQMILLPTLTLEVVAMTDLIHKSDYSLTLSYAGL